MPVFIFQTGVLYSKLGECPTTVSKHFFGLIDPLLYLCWDSVLLEYVESYRLLVLVWFTDCSGGIRSNGNANEGAFVHHNALSFLLLFIFL